MRDTQESRLALDRRKTVIRELKPETRAQEILIETMHGAVSWLDDTYAASGIVEHQLEAGWRHLDRLLETHSAMVTESRRPPDDLDATAEFVVTEEALADDTDTAPALKPQPVPWPT